MTVSNEVPVPAEQEGADLATRDDPRYPISDPGHEEHLPRLTDVDEKAADRATRQVLALPGSEVLGGLRPAVERVLHDPAYRRGALPEGKYAPSLEGVSNEHIYEALITGPQQMPVFSDQVLTPDDKKAIIGYLAELNGRPNDGGLDLGGIGPVSEGLWAWIVGLGTLMLFALWIAAKGAKAK